MLNQSWSRQARVFLSLCLLVLSSTSISLAQNDQNEPLFLVPARFSELLPEGAEVLHDYDRSILARIPVNRISPRLRPLISELEDTRFVSYRPWRGPVAGHDPRMLPPSSDGYFILALIGPMDARWRTELESLGLKIVDHVNPYGLVVRGNSDAIVHSTGTIRTSRGHAVITHALRLPDEARVDPAVAEWLAGGATAEELGIRVQDGLGVVHITLHRDAVFSQVHPSITDFLETGPEFVPGGLSAQYLATAQSLAAVLDQVPEVAYVHGVYPKELHNNIGAQAHITNIEPVWTDLDYTGAGLVAGVNDSGLDLSHPDFPEGSVVATAGAMSNTDNGHGTHVTGTVAGRGAAPSPENTHACGDVTPPLPDARGMAWGAQIAHNNLFDGGVTNETAMMQWQAEQGAVVNNNSWGYGGLFGPATDYGAESAMVDAAVRDAIPGSGANVPISIVFSAGNSAAQGLSKPANGKNVIAVGASQNDRCGSYIPSQCAGPNIDAIACFSSQGPSQGRIKPDIVAPGTDVLSTQSSDPLATWGGWQQPWTGNHYEILPGTSMAAPMVTGAATVFYEYYLDTHGTLPSPALVKAALINTATDMGLGFPSTIQGWGRLNLRKAIEGPVEDGIVYFDQDEVDHLATGQSWSTEIGVAGDDEPLRITLVWTDPPGAAGCNPCHINDLDLIVTAPDGTVYRGNQFVDNWAEPDPAGRDELNNVENVYIEFPMSGTWTVEISAVNVAENPAMLDGQDFALVATGNFGGISVEPVAANVCTADGSTEFTIFLSNQFQGTTTLAADGLPAGTSGAFNPNPVIFPTNESTFTLSDLGAAQGGEYVLEFTATDAVDPEITADTTANLSLFENVPGQVSLLTPADGAIDQDLRPEFSWQAPVEAFEYRLQVATDDGFATVIIDETLAETSFIPAEDLATGTEFYWRVLSQNACGEGEWSTTFTFQTRFEPVAAIEPRNFELDVIVGDQASDTLFISNIGTGNLVWEIGTDSLEPASLGSLAHDPGLDEAFELPEFTLVGSVTPEEVTFILDGGLLTRGDVVGFSFIGTASGVSDSASWASDTCMVIEAPDGTTFGVGGFGTGTRPECGASNPWDFQGGGSSGDGTYESAHDDAFDPPLADEGQWTVTFVNDWASASAGDITWSDVIITLHKQPLPVCIEDVTEVPWLSVEPAAGSTPAGATDEVTVTVDATGLNMDVFEGYLCLTTNDTGEANLTLLPIPVQVTVFDPDAGALAGTVTSRGYCNASDPAPLAGALVTIEGQHNTFTTTTGSDGTWSININVEESPVNITASAVDHLDAETLAVPITAGQTTTVDLEPLFDAPCATIAPEEFAFDLQLGQTGDDILEIGNLEGNIELVWSVDHFQEGSAVVPSNEPQVVLEEDFAGPFPPDGWTTVDNTGQCPWLTTDDYGMSDWGGNVRGAAVDSDDCGSGTTADAELITPSLDLSGIGDALLRFDVALRTLPGTMLEVDASTDGGTSWTNLETWTSDFAYPDETSLPVEIDLSAYGGEPDVRLRWRYSTTGWHWWVYVDNIVVTEAPPLPPSCENPNEVPWLSMTPDSGAAAPGTTDNVTVSVDTTGLFDGLFEATLCVTTNDDAVALTEIPVTLAVTDPELGILEGTVLAENCALDPAPLAGAVITIVGNAGGNFNTTTDSDGFYSIKIHEDESPVDVIASAAGYLPEAAEDVPITGLETSVADFSLTLDSACIDVEPGELSAIVDLGQTAEETVQISNFGTQTLNWSVEVMAGVAAILADTADYPAAQASGDAQFTPSVEAERAGKDESRPTAEPGEPFITGELRRALLREGVVLIPQSTNNRIMAFDPATGALLDPDFITYEQSLGTLQHILPHPDGERLLVVNQSTPGEVHAFDLEGEYIGVFAPAGGGDADIMGNTRGMAFHPQTGNLLVTSAGGGNPNSVVEFDLDGNFVGVFIESGAGGISGPWSILFRDSDVLVSASGGNIYRYDHDGQFLSVFNDEINFPEQIIEIDNGNILAAAFSAPSGVWEIDPDGNQIAIYGPQTNLRGVYELPNEHILNTNSGGVHEIDRDSNLIETKITGSSHQISFIQTVDCNAPDWVSFAPLAGTVEPGGGMSDTLTVTFDPAGLAPGNYEGNFCIDSNDPTRSTVQIPVSMTAELPADWATIEGTVQGLGHCSANPGPLAGATVEIAGAQDTHVLETDADGFYRIFLPEDESPLEITVSAPNHLGQSATVNFFGGDHVIEDFDLLLAEPCATVAPDHISVNLDANDRISGVLELGNLAGNATLNWQIDTAMPTEFLEDRDASGSPRAGGGEEAALSLADVLGGPFAGMNVINPAQAAVDCEGAPGIIIHDNGVVDNGYSGNPSVVNQVAFADYFVPSTYPASMNAVCVSLLTTAGGPSSASVEIVAFADDGPGGSPGTELGAMEVTVDNLPVWPISEPVWASFDISEMGVTVVAGGVYIGVRYATSDPNVFVAADEGTGNPAGFAGGHWWNNDAAAWAPIESVFPNYRALFVRAVEGVINCDDPIGVPWLGADPAFGIVHAGQAREIRVDIDATGLAPGFYEAGLCIFSNDPVDPVLVVPVDLTVRVPAAWATIEGTVQGLGRCSALPGPLEGATVEVAGAENTHVLQTGSDGDYRISIPVSESPVDITVSAPGHLPATVEGIGLSQGQTLVQDFDLTLAVPCASADPASLEFDLEEGDSGVQNLTIGNFDAGATLNWSIQQAPAPETFHRENRDRFAPANVGRAPPRVIPASEELLAEGFEDGVIPPPGWSHEVTNPGFTWEINSLNPHAGNFYASVFYDPALVLQDEWLLTPPLTIDSGVLTFWSLGSVFWCRDDNDNCDLNVWIVVGEPGDGNDIFVGRADDDWAGNFIWSQSSFELDELLPGGEVRIGFQYVGADGAEISLDSITLSGEVSVVGSCDDPGDVPWLAPTPDSGSTLPGESASVDVMVDTAGVPPGEHAALLCVITNDPSSPLIEVPVSLTVTEAVPEADLTPESFAFETYTGGTTSGILNVGNTGTAALEWTIDPAEAGSCESPSATSWLDVDPSDGSTPAGDSLEVTVLVDAAGLAPGDYAAELCVSTNDPNTAQVAIPVSLSVTEPPEPEANLAISIEAADFVAEGEAFEFLIVVTNFGPDAAPGAHVVSLFDEDGLEDIIWTCTAEDGAACGETAGAGQIDELVDLPVNGIVLYTVHAVLADSGENEESTSAVMVEPPPTVLDPDPLIAFDEITIRSGIFADGFESED